MIGALIVVLLLAGLSLQAPVRSDAFTQKSISHQAAAQATAAPVTLYDLVKGRPGAREENADALIDKFQQDFAAHPAVQGIKLDEHSHLKVVEQLEALRGKVADRAWHKKMTTTVRHHLARSGASKEMIDTFDAHNFAQRKASARANAKRKLATLSPEEVEQRKRRKAEARREKTIRDSVINSNKPLPQLSFQEAMDQRLEGDRRLTAIEVIKMAAEYRFTHFRSELAFTTVLTKYLQKKGFTPKEIGVALAGRARVKQHREVVRTEKSNKAANLEPVSYQKRPRTSRAGPLKTSTSNGNASTLTTSSTGPSVAHQLPLSMMSHSDEAVDHLEESPWWDHHQW